MISFAQVNNILELEIKGCLLGMAMKSLDLALTKVEGQVKFER